MFIKHKSSNVALEITTVQKQPYSNKWHPIECRLCILILLDLIAAFNAVDYTILLNRNWVGLGGTALDWFSSSNRIFKVTVDNLSTSTAFGSCRVPQGSVFGPILFSLYLLPFDHVTHHFTPVSYPYYTDNSQLSVITTQNFNYLDSLHCCPAVIKYQMASDFLQLNTDTTQVLVTVPDHISYRVTSAWPQSCYLEIYICIYCHG